MKILFVSAVLPYPLHSGGQIRIYNLLKRLGGKHEITLCAFVRRPDELQYLRELPFCRYVYMIYRGSAWQPSYVFKASFGRYPFLLATYENGAMRQTIAGLLDKEQYDLVHLEPFYVWPSLPRTNLPVVVGEHNVEYEVYQEYTRRFPIVPLRPLLYLDTLKMRFWEEYVWRKVSAITAVSDHDEAVIRKLNKRVTRVPNGVDTHVFPFKTKKAKIETFLYVGNFRWMENRDAAEYLERDIWPEIKKEYPEAQLRIIGKERNPVESIQDELHKADIMIAPIRIGGGTKFKILEAMASGIPVITTTIGAQGLDKNVLWIADTPKEVVAAIENISKDHQRIKKARKLIEREYDWDTIAESLHQLWTSL